MHPSTIAFFRGLFTLVLVVVVAAAVGAGAGYGLSQAFGTTVSAADELGATGPSGTSGTAARPRPGTRSSTGATSTKPQPKPRLTVLSATLKLATSPSGAARKRARVTVRLRARNPGKSSTVLGTAQIKALGNSQKADPSAKDDAGKLLDPIPGGDTVTGELRFETAGDLTNTLTTTRSATLRVGKKSLPLDLTGVAG